MAARYRCTACGAESPTALETGCPSCGGPLEGLKASRTVTAVPDYRGRVLVTTTPTVEGHAISEYLGPVFGEAILGANLFSDMAAGVRDVVGGRSGSYEAKFSHAREIALREMAHAASELGANAVIGMGIDYETLKGSMLMVSVHGTAAVVSMPSN